MEDAAHYIGAVDEFAAAGVFIVIHIQIGDVAATAPVPVRFVPFRRFAL